MPEKLAELAGAAEGPAAGADGWHELAVAKAFISYQGAAECRPQLAAEIGELASELIATLMAGGWSWREATEASVHDLARTSKSGAGE
jgi:hypothetical protein